MSSKYLPFGTFATLQYFCVAISSKMCLDEDNDCNDKNGKLSTCVLNGGNNWLVAWRTGNVFHPINEVTLRRAGLVLRWVTACGQVNHLGM